MKIVVAKNSGFCFGVKRAMKIIDDLEKFSKEKPLYTLGPIIHNPQVVDSLEEKGIFPLEDVSKVKKGSLILRTHGVEKKLLDKIKRKNIKYIDATCPFVANAHNYVKKLFKEGYLVVIFGEKDHPEILAINSQIDNKGIVVEKKEDVKKIFNLKDRKIGVISQTTQSLEKFKEIVCELMDNFKEIYVVNTICNATSLRQNSAVEVAKKVDLMLVIGGKNSGNTKRLFQICYALNKNTFHIETYKEIESFKEKVLKSKSVGLVAGASTPDWIIDEVVNFLKKIDKEEKKNGRKKK
uniref:4-hydroxy-3-methylbut-2-enyl diphosphate reductase n=1 Tax=candidate division WOR-3 bacterium TaxID=2052148 RepID=A0A7C3NDT3_UNCW3